MENEPIQAFSSRAETTETQHQTAYLDWVSAAPLLPTVQSVMKEALHEFYGNPSSRLHNWGIRSQRELDKARASVAKLIGAWDPIEIIFCASATEANNLAIKGIARASDRGKHIVISAIDHPSVRMSAEALRWDGFTVSYAPVDSWGHVRIDALKDLLHDDTALVSIQHANSEIGSIQPLAEIANLCNSFGVPLHSDGWGIAGFLPVNVSRMGVTAYTIGSNSFWGPVGAAALWLKKGTELQPLLDGGGQELKRRAGTENIPAIIGMGAAAEIAVRDGTSRADMMRILSDKLYVGMQEGFGDCEPVCFYPTGHPLERLPQIASFRLEWVEGEALLLGIGQEGVAAVSGSACARPELGASYVLEACGVNEEQRNGSVTLSVGWSTTEDQIEYAVSRIVHHGLRLFEMSHITESKRRATDKR